MALVEHGLLGLSVSRCREFAEGVQSYGLDISSPNLVDPQIARDSIAKYKEIQIDV